MTPERKRRLELFVVSPDKLFDSYIAKVKL
jgi:hypothetical protein